MLDVKKAIEGMNAEAAEVAKAIAQGPATMEAMKKAFAALQRTLPSTDRRQQDRAMATARDALGRTKALLRQLEKVAALDADDNIPTLKKTISDAEEALEIIAKDIAAARRLAMTRGQWGRG